MPVAHALTEVFTWVGLGGAVVAGLVALVLLILDGAWLPAQGYVESQDGAPVIRWIDADGNVCAARPTPDDLVEIGDRDAVTVYSRRGTANRMRLQRTAHGVRLATLIAVILGGVGVAAVIVSIVLLFVEG